MTDNPTAARTTAGAPLPSHADLLARHAEARHRRDAAPLDSPAYRAAATDIAEIETRLSGLDVVAAGGAYAEPARGAVIETTHH